MAQTNMIGLAIGIIIFATMGWVGLNEIANHNEYVQTTAETIAPTQGSTTQLNSVRVINASDRVYNSTATLVKNGNYTINDATGVITWLYADSVVNGTAYSIDYQSGAVNSSVATLAKTVLGIIISIVAFLVIIRKAGIKIV